MSRKDSNQILAARAPVEPIGGFFLLIKEHPVLVGGAWFVVFSLLIIFSYATGMMPTIERDAAPAAAASTTEDVPQETQIAVDGTPMRIIIDAIGVDAKIMNPTSRDIAVLDEALMQGVVHYPGSGDLEDVTNMLLLGHSTGFRVVHNEAYKVFNGLKSLKKNDVIRVQSDGTEYLYRVKEVSLVNANEASINLRSEVKMLTLATCNVFGAKEERYVVSAEFVGSYPVDEQELDL